MLAISRPFLGYRWSAWFVLVGIALYTVLVGAEAAVVYKAGHHGAKSSSSKAFLEAVRPQYVVVSAGEGNRYGHPHEVTLKRVRDVGAAVLRTNELGTIEVISDGERMWWEARGYD